jgi:hypothetical protein
MRQYLEKFAGNVLHTCLENEENHDVRREIDPTIERFLASCLGG